MLADDLHSRQPFCELAAGTNSCHFILTCKPDSHPTLYEEIALLGKLDAVAQLTPAPVEWTLHGSGTVATSTRCPCAAVRMPSTSTGVSCASSMHRHRRALLYHNAFTTDHRLSDQTVQPILVAGRTRWKIENENNNVLKNYGYHLEHNYGHGKQFLSMILVLLNLLAFLVHTVLDLCDQIYHRLRDALRVRQTFFNDLKALDPLHALRKLGPDAQLHVCAT